MRETATPLQSVDNLVIYDPYFEGAAQSQNAEVGGSGALHPVRSWADVVEGLHAFRYVKFLTFFTHGMPGVMLPPGGANIVGLDFAMIKLDPAFMQKNGRILFMGCNLAEGDTGDLFLDEVGKAFLRSKGGFVGASTAANIMISFRFLPSVSTEAFMEPLSFGRLKVYRYDETGARIAGQVTDRHGWRR